MTSPLVTYAVDGRVGVVTLNRGDKLNAISGELMRPLVDAFPRRHRPGDERRHPPRRGAQLLRGLRYWPRPGPGGAKGAHSPGSPQATSPSR